jgi:hypothetical protein
VTTLAAFGLVALLAVVGAWLARALAEQLSATPARP